MLATNAYSQIQKMRMGGRIVLFGLLIVTVGCTKAEPEKKMLEKVSENQIHVDDEALANIKLQKVVKGDFPEKLDIMGKISVPEDRTIVVPARVSGRTDSVYVSSGEVVTKGQPLASIFSADFSVAKEEYLQAVRDAQKTPNDAEVMHLLELSKKKLASLGISLDDADKWSSDNRSDALMVRAPRAGALIGKTAVVGNIVNVGDSLFVIGDLSKVWFAGDLYPEDLNKVHKDQELMVDIANGGAALKGKVSFISPVIDPNTRTIKIRALIDNPGSQLRADMYVRGYLVLSRRTAFVVPKSAVLHLRNSIFCFRRRPGNIFERTTLKITGENSDSVAVDEGLADGDEVATEGALLLDAGMNGGSGS